MDYYSLFNFIKIALSIIIIISVLWILYSPSILKPIILKWLPDINYYPSKYATVEKNYTLYHRQDKSPNSNLLVWFHGGSFIFCNRNSAYGLLNNLFEKLEKFDILLITYPVRFENTVQDMMLTINNILNNFLTYTEYHAIGISAGVLLEGSFINKERSIEISRRMKVPQIGINFKTFIGINGVYDTVFNSKVLNNLFKYYVMRGTPGIELYNCKNLNIPKLVISSEQDFLYQQTENFLSTEHADSKIFNKTHLDHTSPLFQNIPESKEIIELITNWIHKHTLNIVNP